MSVKKTKGLLQRLEAGETIICAEGYLRELERRGYLKAGPYVPEVVLDRPDIIRALHEEFVHAGSDVVLTFTYYTYRDKVCAVGRENEVEKLNQQALRIARHVADETGTLMAAGLCNSQIYTPDETSTHEKCRAMFKEQVEWFVEGNVDYIVVEEMAYLGEAMLGLEAIKKYGKGLPSVVTMITPLEDTTFEGVPFAEAMVQLKEAGASVVGFNCGRGPETMLPMLKTVRQTYKGFLAALPVCFRTMNDGPSYHYLRDPRDGNMVFPANMSCCTSSPLDIIRFAKEAKDLDVQYVGLCCGASSQFLRCLAEGYGRHPPASKYSPELTTLYGDRDDPLTRKLKEFQRKISNANN